MRAMAAASVWGRSRTAPAAWATGIGGTATTDRWAGHDRPLQDLDRQGRADVFRFQERVHAFGAAFAAEAGFLVSAEWRLGDRRKRVVDTDDPVFEALGDAPRAREVVGVEIGGEPERSSVRTVEHLGLV